MISMGVIIDGHLVHCPPIVKSGSGFIIPMNNPEWLAAHNMHEIVEDPCPLNENECKVCVGFTWPEGEGDKHSDDGKIHRKYIAKSVCEVDSELALRRLAEWERNLVGNLNDIDFCNSSINSTSMTVNQIMSALGKTGDFESE